MEESENKAEELLRLLGQEMAKGRAKRMEPEEKSASTSPSERKFIAAGTGRLSRIHHLKQICAAFLCCILLTAAFTTVSSEAFRARVFGFFFNDKDGYTELVPSENPASAQFFYPEYLPDGYELVSNEDIGGGREIIYENTEKEDVIMLTQFTDMAFELSVDTETTTRESCLVGEYEAYYFHGDAYGDTTHLLIWERNGIFLELSATLPKDEMVKIGIHLKQKK